MPYAITTTFKPATNHHGAMIVAKTTANMHTTGKPAQRRVPYDHAKSQTDNHTHAAHCLVVFCNLTVHEFVGADLTPDATQRVYVPYFGVDSQVALGEAG